MNQDNTICSFDGCEKPRKHKSLGLCPGHMTQHYRGVDLTPLEKTWSKNGPCRFDGCKGERQSLGYCGPHYRQQANGKPLTPITPLDERICQLEECDNPAAMGTRGRPRIYCSDECMHEAHRRMKLKQAQEDPYQAVNGNKLCGQCQTTKPTSEYHNDKKRKDGLYPWCKDCRRVYMNAKRKEPAKLSKREYDKLRREQMKQSLKAAEFANARRDAYLRRQYGISSEQYDALLESQGRRCAICQVHENESTILGGEGTRRRFAVDHDHSCCPTSRSCGECVRGILCHLCNVALGSFKDDPQVMRAAIQYVSAPAALRAA